MILVEAEKYFRIITETYPMSKFASLAFIELGNIKMQQAKLDEAEKLFQSVIKLHGQIPKIKVMQIISLQEYFLLEMILNLHVKI